jgi:hypothetical protein
LADDIEVSVRKGKTGDISFDFNDLKAYDNNRLALIKEAVFL